MTEAIKHPTVFFTIKAGQQLSLPLWIEERSGSTDLTIKFRAGQYLKLIKRPGDEITEHEVKEHHISVHNSRESKTGVNVIIGTILFRDGTTVPNPQFTRAIKQNENYAHVVGYRCTDLSHPKFKSSDVPSQSSPELGRLFLAAFGLTCLAMPRCAPPKKSILGQRNGVHFSNETLGSALVEQMHLAAVN
jgi:hypothetical protein